ncbi:hypothetical protein RhiJN_27089 [Ceratobasidium sp. AG-Ba]|nr:hypothetical protein RhiJN_27089 [Ceratobasidium sp. AG-Ba]
MSVDMPPSPAPRPTYASVAVSARLSDDKLKTCPVPIPRGPSSFRIPPQSRPKNQQLKAPVLNPVRLVVRPSGKRYAQKPFAVIHIAGPSEPYQILSRAMRLSPSGCGISLLGVHVNRSENLIVSLAHGTSDAQIAIVSAVIQSTFAPLLGFDPLITQDIKWSKFMVSSVPTRSAPSQPTFSEEEVFASFKANPSMQALSITRAPRWVRNPASISGAHSSFTFSFLDPDGSISTSLAKSSLFMFGAPVHLKRWVDKPRQTRS